MLGINIEAFAKSEIAKVEAKLKAVDADHDGLPDLAEVQKIVSAAVVQIQTLEAKVSPAQAAAALNLLFPGVFSAADISKAEGVVAEITDAFAHLQGLAAAAEAAL